MKPPPIIRGAVEGWERRLPAAMFAAVGAAVLYAALNGPARLPLPPCGWRSVTGWPCPFCGTTRCLTALVTGDWRDAIQFNPLTVLGVVLAAGLFMEWIWRVCRGDEGAAWMIRVWRVPGAGWWMAGLVAVNWLYLCAALPR